MKTYYAKDYGILPSTEVASNLNDLLSRLSEDKEEKKLIFEEGEYTIDVRFCPVRYYHITNTIGEDEYDPWEEKWRTPTAILFENITNLTLEGNHSVFLIDGVCTNMVIDKCQNLAINNIEIKVLDPNVHTLRLEKKGLFHSEYAIVENNYRQVGNDIVFEGNGYRYPLLYQPKKSFCNSCHPSEPTHYTRFTYPFKKSTYSVKNGKVIGKNKPFNSLRKGQIFYVFDTRRKQVGTFVNESSDISFFGYNQRFSYSLAMVCQDTKNIIFDTLDFAPEKGKRQIASLADFLHICCCRGKVEVKNSHFSSSNDDVINVHAVHFPILSLIKNKVVIRFAHKEAYGFNVFHPGDKIAVIGKYDLLEKKTATVISSKMRDLYTIELTLDTEIGKSYSNCVIENIECNPSLLFENNILERISTRGILVTSRGKVVIKNNKFVYTKMNTLEVADDAMDWYEGNMVKDISLDNNEFFECEKEYVHVFPHNLRNNGYVHENLTFSNNVFHHSKNKKCYTFRCADKINLVNNTYIGYKKRNILQSISSRILNKDF